MERIKNNQIKIVTYQNFHQSDIDQMIKEIALEFNQPISSKPTKSTPLIPNNYWVAINNNEVIGTIGVVKIKKEFAILKKMFLKKSFRGKIFGVSNSLLQTSFNWCIKNGIEQIYLGTMDQFIGAHKFYLKNGFQRISKNNLPDGFLSNPMDNVFFQRKLDGLKAR
ncbi:hypothetical protein GCM10023311_02990 [Flaviramulus aquimarinus]|uniref:N-acetyltransferase domain-containing protein n=1 Tax=Flaviramulus aquimarinus TaxID=1170456 RepID=A0ABP9EQ85_9FLAO